MNDHLSNEEMTDWTLGRASEASVAHVRACADCRETVERTGEVLQRFGQSARSWGERQRDAEWRGRAYREKPALARMRFGMGLAVVALVAVSWSGWHWEQRKDAVVTPKVASDGGTEWLSQVDQEISRTVPTAMDPLSALVATRDGKGQ